MNRILKDHQIMFHLASFFKAQYLLPHQQQDLAN